MKERKIKLRPFRIAGYVILYGINIGLYFILRSYFFWLTAIILAIAPLLSVSMLFVLSNNIRLSVICEEERITKGDTCYLDITLESVRKYCVALECITNWEVGNTFWEASSGITLSMPISGKNKSTLRLPVRGEKIGQICFDCNQILLQDLMGLVQIQRKIDVRQELFVLPKDEDGLAKEVAEYGAGMTEVEESKEKGSDFAEVSEIREYVPGDRIRDIHWKLSAKQDTLMVKERIAMAGSELVILMRLSERKNESEEVIERTYHLCRGLLVQKIPFRLLCWNQGYYSFEEYSCSKHKEVENAFCEVFCHPVSCRNSESQEIYMKNCYPYLSRYLIVWSQNGTVQLEIKEND